MKRNNMRYLAFCTSNMPDVRCQMPGGFRHIEMSHIYRLHHFRLVGVGRFGRGGGLGGGRIIRSDVTHKGESGVG